MTEMLEWLGAWYNLLPLFCVLLATGFALVQIFFGFLPDGAEMDLDVDGLDVDVDVDADMDLDVDADADVEGWDLHGLGPALVGFLGLRKAPTSLLLLLLTFLFGAISLVVFWLLGPLPGIPVAGWIVVTSVYGGSLFLAGAVTGRCAYFIGKAMPRAKTTTKPAGAIVGKSALAITSITPRGGQAKLGSRYLQVLSAEGTIARGQGVLLVSYDKKRLAYIVEPI